MDKKTILNKIIPELENLKTVGSDELTTKVDILLHGALRYLHWIELDSEESISQESFDAFLKSVKALTGIDVEKLKETK